MKAATANASRDIARATNAAAALSMAAIFAALPLALITGDGAELRDQVLQIMNEPPAAIAALSVADQRTLRDVLKRAVENLR